MEKIIFSTYNSPLYAIFLSLCVQILYKMSPFFITHATKETLELLSIILDTTLHFTVAYSFIK